MSVIHDTRNCANDVDVEALQHERYTEKGLTYTSKNPCRRPHVVRPGRLEMHTSRLLGEFEMQRKKQVSERSDEIDGLETMSVCWLLSFGQSILAPTITPPIDHRRCA